jgi:pantothenate kinase
MAAAQDGWDARTVTRPPVVPADLDMLAARIASLGSGRRVLLGVAGAPGAGKSTLAAGLASAVRDAVVVPMDGFHLTTAELAALGRVERRGAPDTFDAGAFVAKIAELRDATRDVCAPGFDRTAEEPVIDAILVPGDCRLVIVEGNYLLVDDPPWSRLGDLLDAVWFVEIPEPLRVQRLMARFVSFGMPAEHATHRVMRGSDARNAELVAATRPRADLIIVPAG